MLHPNPRFATLLAGLCTAALAGAVPLTVTVLDAAGAPLSDAVVSVEVRGIKTRAAPATVAELGQRDKRFTPTVLAVQTGTEVSFPNHDTVRHHVYSLSKIKPFELKLYAGTPASTVRFDLAGTAVLGCNIHDTMTAYVRVVDTPYFSRTDSSGHARFELPPGEHRLAIWHPSLPTDTPVPERSLQLGGSTTDLIVVLP